MMVRDMVRLFLAFLILLTSCASPLPKAPDLKKVFEKYREFPKKEPLIFIPGLFGSMLVNDKGDIIWGQKRSVLKQHTFNREMLLPIGDGEDHYQPKESLQPLRLLQNMIWVPNIYEIRAEKELINTLENAGGYRLGDINNPTKEHDFYYFSYDWRRDIVEAVAELHKKILAIQDAWGDPNLKVNLVAHSMGGLIARYYIKYGSRDLLDLHWIPPPTFAGAKYVNKLVTVGTPHIGSAVVVGLLNYGLPMWRLRPRINPETMLTWPSIYQLLPSRGTNLFLNKNGKPIKDFNVYDIKSWEEYKIGPFNPRMINRLKRHYGEKGEERRKAIIKFMSKMLNRADQFHIAIESGEGSGKYPLPVIGFAGDCLLTPEYAVISEDGEMEIDSEELNVPGDGSVSRDSFLGLKSQMLTKKGVHRSHIHLDHTMFICETHSALTDNATFHDNLLHALLTEEKFTTMEGN